MRELFSLLLGSGWPLVLLLAGLADPAQGQGLVQPRSQWSRVLAGGELTRYQDDDPFRFKDAQALTRSLYLSAGTGEGGLVALGLNALRLEQDGWAHETRRVLTLLELPTRGPATVLLDGFTSSGTKSVGGRGFSVGARLGQGSLGLRITTGWQRHWIEHEAGNARDREQAIAGLGLSGTLGQGAWELAWLGQRRTGEIAHAGRALWRLPVWPGARLTLHGLGGRQEAWYDGQRLVLHDSGQALTGMASAALSQSLGHHLFLDLAAGWERVKDHESRWVFAGLGWRQETWLP